MPNSGPLWPFFTRFSAIPRESVARPCPWAARPGRARAHTRATTLDTPLKLTQTRRDAMKPLCGDRSESVPRPQRAQRAHERARRRPQTAAAAPSRRRSAHGARSARFFSREAPTHGVFLRYSRQARRSARAARHARARGLQANHAESWPGPSIPLGARSARKFSRKSFSKEFLPLSGAAQSV